MEKTIQELTEVGLTKLGDGTEKYPDVPSVPSELKPKLEMYYQFDNEPPHKFGESANPTIMIGFHPKIRNEIMFQDKVAGKKFRLFAKEVKEVKAVS